MRCTEVTPNTKKQGENHKEKFHKIVSVLSQSPLVSSVRTLFRGDSADDRILPSTQGDSNGRVNSPKVVTEGTFQCNECPEEYERKSELMKHMTLKHKKAQAATTNNKDIDKSATKSDIEQEEDDDELREIAEDLEDEGLAVEVQEMIEPGNMLRVDKIVNSLVETVFHEMNPDIVRPSSLFHECELKDQIFNNQEKSIDEKEGVIVEKTATIKGLMETIKNMTKEGVEVQKKAKETDNLKKSVGEKNKKISNLKAEVKTKDGLLAMAQAKSENVQTEVQNTGTDEVTVEAKVKKCKKCKFTAPNLHLLALHIENDHQFQFDCNDCNKKFPSKNQFKIHRREVHEQG